MSRCTVMDPDAMATLLDRERMVQAPEELEHLEAEECLRAIGYLPLAQRQVLTLRYLLGFEVEETAEILSATPNAIRNLQHRAFKALRPRLEATEASVAQTSASRFEMTRAFNPDPVVVSRRLALQIAI